MEKGTSNELDNTAGFKAPNGYEARVGEECVLFRKEVIGILRGEIVSIDHVKQELLLAIGGGEDDLAIGFHEVSLINKIV